MTITVRLSISVETENGERKSFLDSRLPVRQIWKGVFRSFRSLGSFSTDPKRSECG